MAARDLSKTFEEVESEDFSLETSLPTDMTMSPDHSEAESKRKKRHLTKQLIERKQLVHDMQLLKIEVSQKNLALENMKAEHLQQFEELEERLHDATHQKQILQARLESELQIQSEEARKRQELIKRELDAVCAKQQQLEGANKRLQEKAGDVRRSLQDLTMSEERFYHLRALPEEEISLRDYVAMRLFEALKPVQTEVSQLRTTNKSIEDEVSALSRDLLDTQKKLEEERQAHGEIRVQYNKLTTEYAETASKVKSGDYKVENYDKVKLERDTFESDQLEACRQLMTLEASFANVQKERDELSRDYSSAKQTIALLKQDKDFLARQHTEALHKAEFAEEKLQQFSRQLEDAKLAREEMYEKYVASRDQYKSEYENKLKEELEQIRVRTNGEIDRLRTSTREMYERENRNLREARDLALSERDRSIGAEREMNTKYDQLMTEFHQSQSDRDSKESALQNDLKIKMFEAERTQMIHAETVKNLGQAEMDIEKLQKKAEVLTKEYYGLQTSMEKRIVELESALSEKNAKLEAYEKLEQDLDSVVMQAAEGSSLFPLKFCSHRWLENVPVCDRALELWSHLQSYVKGVTEKSVPKPTSQSYKNLVACLSDKLMKAKVQSYMSLAEIVQPFLKKFQTDAPVMPFFASDLFAAIKRLLERCVKPSVLSELREPKDVGRFDINEDANFLPLQKVDLGMLAERSAKSSGASAGAILQMRGEMLDFVKGMVKKVLDKTPLCYSPMTRLMSCLHPDAMVSSPIRAIKDFTSLLNRLADLKQLHLAEGDHLKSLFRETCDKFAREDVIENEDDAEKVLFSYGYGANVASTTKRRMQQSVHLARRVLQMEKANTSLRKDITEYKNKINSLVKEVENTNNLLDQSQQPYSYLIQSIKTRDGQIQQQAATIQVLEEDLRRVEKERGEMARTQNQMSLDLERLLNQKEEMAVMKQVVLSLSERKLDTGRAKARDFRPSKSLSTTSRRFQQAFETHDDPNVVKPGSLHMSKAKPAQSSTSNKRGTNFSKVYGVAKT